MQNDESLTIGSGEHRLTKSCPFCAEEVAQAAIKCKHCGEFLDGRNAPVEPAPVVKKLVFESMGQRLKQTASAPYKAGKVAAENKARGGNISPQLLCPHCEVRGQVRTTQVKTKKGISGGKAAGAILTGGVSLLATGLSRKGMLTQATCGNCNMTWTIT